MGRQESRMFGGGGDDGYTFLMGGKRVAKYALAPEALGTLDEVSAALGLARAAGCHPTTAAGLKQIQRDLMRVMGDLAHPQGESMSAPLLPAERRQWLEEQIRHLEEQLPTFEGFVLAGDSFVGALLHLARTVVRRSERVVARMVHEGWDHNPQVLAYLNRLSSYLFVLALWEDRQTLGRSPLETREA
jgi:cob(I)alamin adenosyltransferase